MWPFLDERRQLAPRRETVHGRRATRGTWETGVCCWHPATRVEAYLRAAARAMPAVDGASSAGRPGVDGGADDAGEDDPGENSKATLCG